MVKITFEDDEAWQQHLREVEGEKAVAWREGHAAALHNVAWPYERKTNPYAEWSKP